MTTIDLSQTIEQLQRRLKEVDAEHTDIVAALVALEKVANPKRVSGAGKTTWLDDTSMWVPPKFEFSAFCPPPAESKMSLSEVFSELGWTDWMACELDKNLPPIQFTGCSGKFKFYGVKTDDDDDDDDAPFTPETWVKDLGDCVLSLGQVFAKHGWTGKMAERAARHWTKVDFRPGAVNYVWVSGNVSRPGFEGPVAKR